MAPATVLVRSPEVTPSADPSVPILLTPAPVTPPAVGTVAAPCPALPTCVKLDVSTYRIFLMSTGVAVGADLVAAWRKGSQTQAQHSPCQLLHYNCSHTHEPLVLLDALDRIRDGYFDAVILIPPASSWSRVRHSSNGQVPLRSRSHPLGLPDLSAVGFAKLKQSNQDIEVAAWFAAQALECSHHRVGMLWLFPEDFGGHATEGPSSIWALQNTRLLAQHQDVRRLAFFRCQFENSSSPRPLSALTNMTVFDHVAHVGWPDLRLEHNSLKYHGPLPKKCPCADLHPPVPTKGTGPENGFHSSVTFRLGEEFWKAVFPKGSAPLRAWSEKSTADTTWKAFVNLSSHPDSWSTLYESWKYRLLTRHFLREHTSSGMVDAYLSKRTDSSMDESARSPWASYCSVIASDVSASSIPSVIVPIVPATTPPVQLSDGIPYKPRGSLESSAGYAVVPPSGSALDPGTCRPTSSLRNVRSRSTRSLQKPLALPWQRVEHGHGAGSVLWDVPVDDPVARS